MKNKDTLTQFKGKHLGGKKLFYENLCTITTNKQSKSIAISTIL